MLCYDDGIYVEFQPWSGLFDVLAFSDACDMMLQVWRIMFSTRWGA